MTRKIERDCFLCPADMGYVVEYARATLATDESGYWVTNPAADGAEATVIHPDGTRNHVVWDSRIGWVWE